MNETELALMYKQVTTSWFFFFQERTEKRCMNKVLCEATVTQETAVKYTKYLDMTLLQAYSL